jgi:phospholipid-binding lipoprotein MlaA
MNLATRGMRCAAALALVGTLAGCATMSTSAPSKADPFEPFNRVMFAIHEPIDTNIVRPIAQAWVDYVPTPIQSAVHTFFGNIEDGFSAFNSLLQGKWERPGTVWAA